MSNRQFAVAFPLFCLGVVLMLFVGCIAWRIIPQSGRMDDPRNHVQIEPKPEIKTEAQKPSNKTVMGHITEQQLVGEDLRLVVCTEKSCNSVLVTKRTEIIVTNLNGLRELQHTPDSVFELLNRTKDCDAAVGVNPDGKANMLIIYLPE